ncbi:MAG TPA: SDR family oxidoreductase [Verrucomicrobiae bacterium]|nr:SDR family oxidoreductase [Verrucomicrobiae bacterium]
MDSWALITGASSGIGRELAIVFAENGYNLILVARDQARLAALADELRSVHNIQTRVLRQDLAEPGAAFNVFRSAQDIPVAVLVNNAGFGAYGPFAESDLATQSSMMQVNIMALVELTHRFLQPIRAKGAGRILNVASTAAFQPGPGINVYYASKAFVYSFSYALADELAGTGITVTALCPGLTRTEFQKRAQLSESGAWPMMSARAVAEAGYRGLMAGKRVVIPGLLNRIATFFARRTPPRITSLVVRKIHQRRS